jgi:hypothetical protein
MRGEEESLQRGLRLLYYWNAIQGLYPAENCAGGIFRTMSQLGDFLWINQVFHSAHLLSSKD